MKRLYLTIYRYIAMEYFLSFLVSFMFFLITFIANQLLYYAETLLSKNAALGDVLLFILYSLPMIIAMSFPFASLVGALMAVGRFSSDNEIIAFQSSGINIARIFAPFFAVGCIFFGISFMMNDYFLPLGNINFYKLYRKMTLKNPEIVLQPFSVKRYQNSIIISGAVKNKIIHDIIIIDTDQDNQERMICAKKAFLVDNEQQIGVFSLQLEDVFSHAIQKNKSMDYEYAQAKKMLYNLLIQDLSNRDFGVTPKDMTSLDLYRKIEKGRKNLEQQEENRKQRIQFLNLELQMLYRHLIDENENSISLVSAVKGQLQSKLYEIKNETNRKVFEKSLQLDLMEFYQKFSIPLGCLTFVLIAFPIGLFTRKSGRTMGFIIGLFISIAYWGLLYAGKTVGIRSSLSPFFAIFLPNLLILGTGGILFFFRKQR